MATAQKPRIVRGLAKPGASPADLAWLIRASSILRLRDQHALADALMAEIHDDLVLQIKKEDHKP